eukprot:3227259-Prymnesium_polylepis.2
MPSKGPNPFFAKTVGMDGRTTGQVRDKRALGKRLSNCGEWREQLCPISKGWARWRAAPARP